MGRPKGSKNKPKEGKSLELQEIKSLEQQDLKNLELDVHTSSKNLELDVPIKSKSRMGVLECSRCHKEVDILNTINLTQLTGLADYYRASKNGKLSLCSDCAKELNKVVDSFLYNNGKGVEIKPWSLTPDEYKEPVEGSLNGSERANRDEKVEVEDGVEITLAVDTKPEIKDKEDDDFDF